MKVVVDTNCLLASFSKKSPYRWFFDAIIQGELTIAFSTDILAEYEEIVSRKTSQEVAQNLINYWLIYALANRYRFTIFGALLHKTLTITSSWTVL